MAFKSSQVNFIAIKTSSGQWRKSGLSLRKCCSVWKHTCLYINCVTSGYFCVRWELRGNVAVWPRFSLLICICTFDLSLLFSLFFFYFYSSTFFLFHLFAPTQKSEKCVRFAVYLWRSSMCSSFIENVFSFRYLLQRSCAAVQLTARVYCYCSSWPLVPRDVRGLQGMAVNDQSN